MRILICIAFFSVAALTSAQERRAPPPTFTTDQLRGVFFENLDHAIRGKRPALSALRRTHAPAPDPTGVASDPRISNDDRWSRLIGPASLEDEVKRIKLHFDSVVTTPSAFNSGGYQEARVDLTALATLFAVIDQHSGEVRWKKHAASARDLIARTATNCKAGSTQVYNEAKLRKADLQDLISGSGLSSRDGKPIDDWSKIADRSPLMEYAEALIETLEDATNSVGSINGKTDQISRYGELIAMLGEVLTREGMEDADDEDYVKLSRVMVGSAQGLASSLERPNGKEIQSAVGSIRKSCDACHEQYR